MDILAVLGSVMTQWVFPIFLFLVGLGMVVFFHELGHFLAAKWVGIKVEQFAMGFGPNIFSFKRGETEYCLKILPLGGYVKMVGQEDFAPLKGDESIDPRSFAAKSIAQRMLVISAGVIMNIILAGLMFVIVGVIGIDFPAAVIGEIRQDSPASKAIIAWEGSPSAASSPSATSGPADIGLKPGDKIVTINGTAINHFGDVAVKSILAGAEDKFIFVIERDINGKTVRGTTTIGVAKMDTGIAGKLNGFGISPAGDNKLADQDNTPAPFQSGDKIIAINGLPIGGHWDITAMEDHLDGSSAKVTVLRNGQKIDLQVTPQLSKANIVFLKDGTVARNPAFEKDDMVSYDNPAGAGRVSIAKDLCLLDYQEKLDVLGMSPRVQIGSVAKGTPAEKIGVQSGDIIVDYAEQGTPTFKQLTELNAQVVERQPPGADIVLLRDGKLLPQMNVVPKKNGNGAIIGFATENDLDHSVIAGVRPDSPAQKAGLRSGDEITAINNIPVANWRQMIAATDKCIGKDITITYLRNTVEYKASLGVMNKGLFDSSKDVAISLFPSQHFEPLMTKIQKNPAQAIGWGLKETGNMIVQTYATIHRLITRDVSTEAVMGPLGIADVAVKTARTSLIKFVYLMAVLSVAVAVFNFLPLPVFDGGLAALLILEKIRGKPLPVKITNAIQYVGLVLILMLFVAITWQDIARLLRS